MGDMGFQIDAFSLSLIERELIGLTGTAFAKTARMLAAIFENFILGFSFKFVLLSVRLLW